MKKIIIESLIEVYDSVADLGAEDQALFQHARDATNASHSPYSSFAVGAALRLDNGQIILGSNQENASFPAGICAERVALSAASSLNPNSKVLAVAVSARSNGAWVQKATPPCGVCRQSIKEYEYRGNHPIEILFPGTDGKILKVKSIEALLPLSFNADNLLKR